MKSPIEFNALSALLTIAQCAIEYHDADVAVRAARYTFFDACEVCKAEMGISDYIQRATPAWEVLAEKTSAERLALQQAKRVRYNAARRLQSAVRRHRAKGE
ncbi:hypothetical protein [Paraburkholderia sp. SIMBA_054]|uniref:hypothetical protein n=1 Tax=Paraburkholderia sp. SIMBA_054 TaxID=3085795 RepID=UPI00397CCD4E